MASRGAPFKVTSPSTPPLRRDGAGQFAQRYVPPAPPQVVDEARAAGVNVIDHVHTIQAPEHPTPGGRRGVAEELAPIPAQPPARPPMRLK